MFFTTIYGKKTKAYHNKCPFILRFDFFPPVPEHISWFGFASKWLVCRGTDIHGWSRWRDNVMGERLWRSLKYECIYLRELATASELWQTLASWFDLHNNRRPHFAFDGKKPMEVYREGLRCRSASHAAYYVKCSTLILPLTGLKNRSTSGHRIFSRNEAGILLWGNLPRPHAQPKMLPTA